VLIINTPVLYVQNVQMLFLVIQKVSISEIDTCAQNQVNQEDWPARAKRLSERGHS
jgi:hypothetical protein